MSTLSEAESKARLRAHGVPVAIERLVSTPEEAVVAAEEIGYPVVAKLCGPTIAHKTERGLVRLGLRDAESVRAAAGELLDAATPDDGAVGVLIGELVRGNRELIAGLVRDPQFGPCVMLGVGGILAEAVADVAFRLVPVTATDAEDLIDDLHTRALFGEFRGEPAIDRSKLIDVLVGLSRLAESDESVLSADVNPLIVRDGVPIAVDALVELTQ
jgi:succinyl-CoA synthetase beta subunit